MKASRAKASFPVSGSLAPRRDVEAIVAGTHADPFAILGVHETDGAFVARAFIPHAETVDAFTLDGKPCGTLARSHDAGFFEGPLTLGHRQPLRYRAANAGGERHHHGRYLRHQQAPAWKPDDEPGHQ